MIVLSGQSLFDLAIQSAGSAEAAISLAIKNDISVTDSLEPGSALAETDDANNRAVADYFRINNIHPATSVDTGKQILIGIGRMTIAENFVIK